MSSGPEPFAAIAQGADYELLGRADGSAYLLRCKADRRAAHLDGEDAERFRADYEAVRSQFAGRTPDQMLAQLWDQGGYG